MSNSENSQIYNPQIPIAMTIAGSDSGGGAGIQADLRTFAFHCVHGTSVLTCITAQNTQGVTRVDAMSAEAVSAQFEAVMIDMRVVRSKQECYSIKRSLKP
jgi:hydroxymethylpyrimidine/phosphomethylpyrimidine kinase